MGLQYKLINLDKKERISFFRVDTGTKLRELAGTEVAGNIVTWYLLQNIGDRISFVDDHSEEFTLFGSVYKYKDFYSYPDITERIIQELIAAEILEDNGVLWIDEEDDLYFKDLKNVWFTGPSKK